MREHTQAIIIYFYFREEKNSCFTGFSDFQCHEIRALRIHMISLIPDGTSINSLMVSLIIAMWLSQHNNLLIWRQKLKLRGMLAHLLAFQMDRKALLITGNARRLKTKRLEISDKSDMRLVSWLQTTRKSEHQRDVWEAFIIESHSGRGCRPFWCSGRYYRGKNVIKYSHKSWILDVLRCHYF